MIRDFILPMSEFLFWVLGGVPIMNSLWIVPYVAFIVFIMGIPLHLATTHGVRSFHSIVFVVSFFPLLMISMGPPIVQMQMLQECETVGRIISTDRIDEHVINIRQCRVKDNYYGEFGEWSIAGNGR